jgi:hypothetical protein
MTLEQVAQLDPNGPVWHSVLADLPATTISRFACGHSLIATK